MDRLSRMPLGINLSHLFPVTPLVAYVMGGFDEAKTRFPNEKETAQIARLLAEGMEAGAAGWSAQRLAPEVQGSIQRDYDGTPMVSDVLPDELYLALARVLREKGAGCIQLTQATPQGPEHDFAFNVRLAEESGRPVLYNVIVVNDRFPEFFRMQLQWLTDANAKGTPVFGQTFTARAPFRFTFEDWNLFDDSPVWRQATLGTVEERRAKLADPATRQAMREEYDAGTTFVRDFLFGELPTFIAKKVRRPDLKERYEGLSVGQIAEREGKHVIDALLDLSVADDLRTEWQTPLVNANVENYRELMSSPYTIPGVSDGGAHVKFLTPGTFPTDMLTWMVRETGILSLEEAHFRLSCLPAWAAGFKDRGCLREGLAADLVVYDLEKLRVEPSEVAYDLPAGEWRRVQRAGGYRWIMVNGQVTFEDGQCTGATPGALLRHGRAG